MSNCLKVEDLSVAVEDPPSHKATAGQCKKIVSGVDLTVQPGEIHVLMGPNGSGKSSLALALMGHPSYRVTSGRVSLGDDDLLSLKPNERAKKGLFLSFQNPIAVPGVTLGQLIWSSYKNINGDNKTDIRDFYTEVKKQAKLLGLKEEMLDRFVNEGFSGGEKKKAEVLLLLSLNLQHRMLQTKVAIFDEIDSGLDVDSLRKIARVIEELVKKGTGVILITHSQRILKYLKADFVHVMEEGRIVKSGNSKLAEEIEKSGYAKMSSPIYMGMTRKG